MPFAVNLVASSMVGAATSWVISSYYFSKESRTEKIAEQIRVALQNTLIRVIYPQFFTEKALRVTAEQPTPKDKDIPHLQYATFSDGQIWQGQNVELLVKVVDLGFDLTLPHGVAARDHQQRELGIRPLGLGHFIVDFSTSENDLPGRHRLTFVFQDSGAHKRSVPNRCTQNVAFTIKHRSDE